MDDRERKEGRGEMLRDTDGDGAGIVRQLEMNTRRAMAVLCEVYWTWPKETRNKVGSSGLLAADILALRTQTETDDCTRFDVPEQV